MTPRGLAVAAALLLLVGVAAGAFGAHALRTRVAGDLLAIFQTGVQYHLVHALGALAVAILWLQRPQATALGTCGWLLVLGIVLFSGSLYALALSGIRGFGAITPLGGLAWLVGWALLAWTAWHNMR